MKRRTERKKKRKDLRTDHDRRRVRVAGRHLRHNARVGHSYASHPSNSQLIVNYGHWVVRRSHLAGSRLMILGRGVMTTRALPVSVATELEILAVLHGSAVQLETVPEEKFPRENKSRFISNHFCLCLKVIKR